MHLHQMNFLRPGAQELIRIRWLDDPFPARFENCSLLISRITPQRTNQFTMLYALGSALLRYAVEVLDIEELCSWNNWERGDFFAVAHLH